MYLSYYTKIKATLDPTVDVCKGNVGRIVTRTLAPIDAHQPKRVNDMINKIARLSNAFYVLDELTPNKERYTEFKIPKASGGFRTLHAPDYELKKLQKEFANFLIRDCRVLSHNAVHSYAKKRNCRTALASHQQRHARWFLKLDIKDFFNNCSIAVVQNIFDNIYPLNYVAGLLSITTEHLMLDGGLPQGSPASPILSNLVLMDFDYLFTIWCKENGFHYTRYADDILITKNTNFQYTPVVDKVKELLLAYGFELKMSKLRYGSCNGANWNLGLMYNKDLNVTVGYQNKHIFKCRLHNLQRNPNKQDAQWTHEHEQLKGLASYYSYIEPEYFSKYKETIFSM